MNAESTDSANKNPNPGLELARLATHWMRMATDAKSKKDEAKIVEVESTTGIHDNHPFFSYYEKAQHQQNMMQDTVRTSAYQSAILANASTDFEGKIVVDVGTGSGILAWFALQAGAKHVYAIEASGAVNYASRLFAANGVADRVTIIKGKVEEVELPEGVKADVIISEPMGFMLLHERMLESYIIARKRFLKAPTAEFTPRMYPSTGTIFATPFSDTVLWNEQESKVQFWHNTDFYGLNLNSCIEAAKNDHFSQAVVGYIDPNTLLSAFPVEHQIDFEKDEPESLHIVEFPLNFIADKTAVCHGLALWFDVAFQGGIVEHSLSTSPYGPGTHWQQCRLLLKEPLAVNKGQRITGSIRCLGNKKYSYDVTLTMTLPNTGASTSSGEDISSTTQIALHDQYYSHYSIYTPSA